MRLRSGLHVVYRAKEYHAARQGERFILFSDHIGDQALGFVPIGGQTVAKEIAMSEADAVYEKKWWVRYKGKQFPAEPGNSLWRVYTGQSQPPEYGFVPKEPGYYECYLSSDELDDYWAETQPPPWT